MIYLDVDYRVQSPIDSQTQACLNLWASVFRQGILDTVDSWGIDHDEHWFDSDEIYPGSWVWLCELFGYAPDKARDIVRIKAKEILRKEKERKNRELKAEVRSEMEKEISDSNGLQG